MTAELPVRRRRTRLFLLIGLAFLVVLIGAAAWVGVRAFQAKDALESIVPLASELQDAASARDLDRADAVTQQIATGAARAADLSGDPVWRAAEILPWIGPNLAAVRVTSAQLDALASSAVAPIIGVARSLSETPADGSAVNLAALSDAQPQLAEAANVLSTAQSELAGIDTGAVIVQLRDGVTKVRSVVDDAVGPVHALADASAILPAMLGADGPRTILLAFQNNAELRTGGGITGSFAELHAENGNVSLVAQADSSDFAVSDQLLASVPESTVALYGSQVGRYVQDATMTADFPLSATMLSTWWQRNGGTAPDAVMVIDPLVLQSLLTATGPVALPDGSQLTGDDLVQRLLVDPYVNLDPDAQNTYLRAVTGAVFAHLLSDGIDPIAWAGALTTPIAEGRVSVWSAHPEEEDVLATTALAGPLARHQAAGDDAFAVYFNDATGGKMDTYLQVATSTAVLQCRDDGRRDVVVSLTMSSTAPANAESLPFSVTGGGRLGTGAGDIGTIVTVAAPPGWFFGGVTKDGATTVSTDVTDNGFPSSAVRVNLSPSETNVLQFRFTAADDGDVAPTLLMTPLVNAPTTTDTPAACG